MNSTESKTTQLANGSVIKARIEEIKSLVALGWPTEQAIHRVRESSTLGAQSWAAVLRATFANTKP